MLMKKDFLNLKRSRWLLLTLFALLVGASPTWAQVTETFDDWGTTLPDNWSLLNGATYGTTNGYTYIVNGDYPNGSGKAMYSDQSSNTSKAYIVTPKLEANSTISFNFRKKGSSSSTKGYIYIFTYDESTGTVGTSSLWTCRPDYTNEATSKYTASGNINIGSQETRLAILIANAVIDDFTYTAATIASGPALVVKDGSKSINSPYAFNFGLATAGTTHEFTLSNPGTAAVEGLSVSETGDFGATLSATSIAAGETATLTVTMPEATSSSEITISSTTEGIAPFVINASGTIRDASKLYEYGFTALPTDWTTNGSWYYSETNGAYTTTWYLSNNYRLITPLLTVEEGETFFVEAKGYSTSNTSYQHLQMQYSADGTTWTNFDSEPTLDPSNWNTFAFTGVPAGSYYIAINASQADIRMFYGGKLPVGAKFAINTDGSTQNIGIVAVGGALEKSFTITNSGNTNLQVSFTPSGGVSIPNYVLFTDALNWGTANIYYWGGTASVAWPGVAMTECGTNEYGQKQFRAVVPTDATGIIFNNGSSQTVDVAYTNGTEGFYTINEQEDGKYKVGSWNNGPGWNVAAGGSRDFTIALNSATTGTKSGNVELAFEALNVSEFTIPVSGYVFDASKYTVDFNDNQLPDGWTNGTNGGSSWTFANGEAYGQYVNYKNAKMTSPLLTVAEGESMVFGVKGNTPYANMKVNVSDKAGNSVKSFTFDDEARAAYSAGSFTTVMIDGLEAGDYRLEFEAYNTYIDNIIGFEINQNDPKLGVYIDAECTSAAATSVTRDFNFVAETPTAFTYYIKNDGTGTMNLSKNAPAGFNVTLDKTAVAAGEHATLTIAFDANKGYHGGNVVVTAEDLGDFTVAVSGVVVDENKFDLDFTTADIPAAWTENNWEKNPNGYAEVGYNSSSMQTSTLVAEANETLVVVAKQSYSSSSYKFGVKYRAVGDDEWTDLIPEANIGTSYVMLHGTIAAAGNYELQFTGNYTQIQRIYGLSKPNAPEMVVYDGVAVAGASYSFNKVTDEADAEAVFTVKNEGKAEMTGLKAELSGDNADDYTVSVSAESVAAGESAIVAVTQKAVVGTHAATLTISADGLESKVIALSGKTVDHTALDIDFEASNDWPAQILQHGDNWGIYYGYARQISSSAASSLVLTPMAISNAEEKLTFKAGRYNNYRDLTVRYTTDGGITWNDFNFGTAETPKTSLKEDITSSSSYNDFTISGIPAGTVAFDFYGQGIKLDDIAGDYKVTSAPLMAFANVSDGISGANLKADGTAVYTLANNGNAAYVGTVALTNVTAAVSGEDVTFESGALTIPAGKTATITVTMAYAAPYGEKTGSLSITSTDWVGDMIVNYNATLVDPTEFVEDFEEGKPAGWYLENWSVTGGEARIYTGVAKAMITEKVGAESGKSTLSFDAKVASGTDEQTLSVSTSTDRKTWSDAQNFTLTGVSQNFNITLAEGNEYYVKFEAANAIVDNIKGVKKLTAPTTDLYLVSSSLPTKNVTPGSSYTATVNVASLIAAETVKAELYFGESKVAETEQEVGTSATTVTLPGTAPTAGTYNVYAKVYVDETSVQTEPVEIVVADTRIMAITAFTCTSDANVQADENNEFTATFDVTVQNNGTASLAANEVSVTLTNGTDAYENGTFTWTAANSNVLYMNTKNGSTDIAESCTLKAWCWNTAEDGEWIEFTKVNDGFYSLALNGKTNFIVCRFNPEGTDEDPWKNVYNKSGDLSLATGNLVKFSSYSDNTMNFSQESMGYLEPTMSTTLKVSVTLSAGEGGSFSFKAKENVSNTQYFISQSVYVTPYVTVALNEATTYDATTESFGKVTLNRPFIAGWNTLVLPFDIDAETFATKFGTGAKLFAFESNTNGELTFTKVENGIKAGTPYLLSLNAAITGDMTFTGVTVQPGTTLYQHDANSNGAWFKGNYVNGFDMEGKHGVTPSGTVQKGGAGSTMKAFRAYITMPDGQNARIAIFDETTGISRILSAKEMSDLNMFNMQGQRVNNNAKGVIIKDGKKIVRK